MSVGEGSPSSDADLVARVRGGDAGAFGDLYKAHAAAVRQVAAAHLREPDAIADVVQESFTRALQSLDKLREPGQFKPWILAIARNAATDQLRFRQRVTPVDDARLDVQQAVGPGPDDLAELHELATQVQGFVGELSRRDATAIAMVTYLGFGPDQVATALGLTPGAAKVVVHRARRRLRQALVLQLMVRQPSLSCPKFRELLDADALQAGKHLDACDECLAAAGAEVIPFGAFPIPAAPS
jgi:RNA polymerase sigma factor (sigma-70 family)